MEDTFPLNATVYSNADALSTMISPFGEKANVVASQWSRHIGEARTGVSSSSCDALTFLETWHYSVHDPDSNTCYLANINGEITLEVSIETDLKVEANLNELNSFRDETFKKRESNLQGSFVYDSFGSTKNTQHCSIHCYFDSNDKCDFHYMYGSTCYLGSFSSDSYIGGPNHHLTTYVYSGTLRHFSNPILST